MAIRQSVTVEGEYVYINLTNEETGEVCDYQIKVEQEGLIVDRQFEEGLEAIAACEHEWEEGHDDEIHTDRREEPGSEGSPPSGGEEQP